MFSVVSFSSMLVWVMVGSCVVCLVFIVCVVRMVVVILRDIVGNCV